jgi:hypothetical protein
MGCRSSALALRTVLEAPGFVSGLNDLTVMREPVEQCGCHFCVAKHARPFAEGEIGGDNDGGALIELADQMEQQLTACLRERQIAKLIENDKVETTKVIGGPALFAVACFRFQTVDQVNDIVETASCSISDKRTSNGDGQMGFAGTRANDKNRIALVRHKRAVSQFPQ